MITKEILLLIAKEKDLQKRTILPFGTLSPHYHTLKDQTFLEGLRTLLKGRKRTMRSRSPSPVFIPSPGPSGGKEPIVTIQGSPPSSAPAPAPLSPIGPPPVVPRVLSPPLVDPSPFAPPSIPTPPSPPPVELPRVATPPLPLVPWGTHQ